MTPVGHTIAGIWTGGIIKKSYELKYLVFYIIIASLPDFDIIVGLILYGKRGLGIHQYYTHNFLFVFIVSLTVYFLTKDVKLTLFTFLILTIHLFLDLIVVDERPPIGINPFFPFYNKFYNIPLLLGVRKGSLHELFSLNNLKAVLSEIVILSPLWLYTIVDFFREKRKKKK